MTSGVGLSRINDHSYLLVERVNWKITPLKDSFMTYIPNLPKYSHLSNIFVSKILFYRNN